jgi:DNA-binding NarL/FixJ family response regulator
MPYARIVILTVSEEDASLFEAIKAGPAGICQRIARKTSSRWSGRAPMAKPIRHIAGRLVEEFARMST